MVCMGDWQIQIIFTQRSENRARVFAYAKRNPARDL